MTDDDIEAAIGRCGAGTPALLESAFQPYLLWLNMATQCGLTTIEAPLVRAYIRAFYNPDGTARVKPKDVLPRAAKPAVASRRQGDTHPQGAGLPKDAT